MYTKQTEALKLAQDWYDSGNENPDDFADMIKKVIALAQQEPAEWLTGCPECGMDGGCDCDIGTWNPPAQRKPLTFSKLCDIEYEITHRDGDFSILKFARAVEAAHGIKE